MYKAMTAVVLKLHLVRCMLRDEKYKPRTTSDVPPPGKPTVGEIEETRGAAWYSNSTEIVPKAFPRSNAKRRCAPITPGGALHTISFEDKTIALDS